MGRRTLTILGAAIALVAAFAGAGCGTSGITPPTAMATGESQYLTPQSVPSPAASSDPNNIANNPFVLWVKQNYPQQAAKIITSYLSEQPGAPDDPSRDQLRAQVLGEVAQQLQKNVQKGVPQGFTATAVGNNVRVSGTTNYQGHNIYVRFEFWTKFLPNGDVEIWQPPSTTYAQAEDVLAEWFGGDITAQAQAQITQALDKAGPQNSEPHWQGVQYFKGGIFVIDPGVCFVNQSAS